MELVGYDRVNWQNLPSTATPRGATNLNRMDKGIADAHDAIAQLAGGLLEGEVTPEDGVIQLVADSYHVIDGTETVTLLMPPDPVQGERVAIYLVGSSGEVTLDPGDNADIATPGTRSVQLVAPGIEKMILTVWQCIDYWATWVMVASQVETTAEFIQGAGEVGLQLLQADNPVDARAAIGVTRENPIAVTDAHTASPGEFIVCITGGYTITIPEEAEHGDTITVVTDQQQTGIEVTVEWFDIQQDTRDTTLAITGQQLTLRYFKDLDLGGGPISGWYATTIDFVWGSASP